jgi:hypothetical protein
VKFGVSRKQSWKICSDLSRTQSWTKFKDKKPGNSSLQRHEYPEPARVSEYVY